MTGQRFAVAAGVIGLAVLTVVLFFSSLASVRAVSMDSFQRTADPQKVIANVVIGLGDEILERSVDEDARSVRIAVRVRSPGGPRAALGVPVPILVSLKQPLGERTVLDHDGTPVPDAGVYLGPVPTPRP